MKKYKQTQSLLQRHNDKFLLWAVTIFLIKIVVVLNISPVNILVGASKTIFQVDGIWVGADGESYVNGFYALSNDGVFAKERSLNYWPAAYPLLIWFLSLLGKNHVFTSLAIIQSLIFSVSIYFFAKTLIRTGLRNLTYIIFLLILLNPTLSLSSLVIGYESLTASGFIVMFTIIIKDLLEKNNKYFLQYLIFNSLTASAMIAFQFRFFFSASLLLIAWLLIRERNRLTIYFVVLSLFLSLLAPGFLIFRNNTATGLTTISTNLGQAMNAGAGDQATGGYLQNKGGVKCSLSGGVLDQDKQLTRCVLNWYLDNPKKGAELFINKSAYFWSPWSGPLASGTMLRNPWLKVNPVENIKETKEGYSLVYGIVGKVVSWMWVLVGIGLLIFGFINLWRQNSLTRVIGLLSIMVICVNWLLIYAVTGDNRFRLPILGLILMLQGVGFGAISKGKNAFRFNT